MNPIVARDLLGTIALFIAFFLMATGYAILQADHQIWKRNRRALQLAKKYNRNEYLTTEEADELDRFRLSKVLVGKVIVNSSGAYRRYELSGQAEDELWSD
jgi:hypothetical protein